MLHFFTRRPKTDDPSAPPRSRFARIRRQSPTPLTVHFRRAPQPVDGAKYELVSDQISTTALASHKTVLRSVGVSLGATVVAFLFASSQAFDLYRTANELPQQTFRGWFGEYTGPAAVSYGMLDTWMQLALGLVALLYPVVHAFLGRGVFIVVHWLCALGDHVFLPGAEPRLSKWSPDAKMMAGAVWPATMLAIPFLAVAVLLSALYRSLWSESCRPASEA